MMCSTSGTGPGTRTSWDRVSVREGLQGKDRTGEINKRRTGLVNTDTPK